MSLSVAVASARAQTPGRAELLVLAPHPDDESLMTAGVLAAAVKRGKRVVVAYATNGDLGCERSGLTRDGEALAALGVLGVPVRSVYFLGYPDGHLSDLGASTLAPLARRDSAANCTAGNTTYAIKNADLHRVLTGGPAPYAAAAFVGDLAALLDRVQPRDIYVSHPVDYHLDHAFTYAYLRRALEHLPSWRPRAVRVHRSLVHVGGCWPTAKSPAVAAPQCPEVRFQPGTAWPELPPPYQAYEPNEARALPAEMLRATAEQNPKFMAIAAHKTQTGPRPPLSYLFSFVRRSEPFWSEILESDADGTIRRRASAGVVAGRVEAKTEFAASDHGYVRTVVQQAPLRCNVFTGSADPSMTLKFLVYNGVGYTLRIEKDVVVLVHEPDRELRRWPVPADAAAPHAYSVSVDPRPDEHGIAELTVRRDWEVLGVAVDVEPILAGDALVVNVDPKRSRPACRAW